MYMCVNTLLSTTLENIREEVWKTLDGFSKYEISSFGKIRNKFMYLLKPRINDGYYGVIINNDENKYKSMKIHRLVALCFLPNPENKATVNHKDHNKENNHVDNLEWATMTEQNNHSRKPTKEIREMQNVRAICRINKDTDEELESYKSIKLAAQWVFDNNLSDQTEFNNGHKIRQKIGNVAQGQQLTTFGYKWKYQNINEHKYENEEWKDIPSEFVKGTTGYQVSNCGRLKNRTGRITDGRIKLSGYVYVSISYDDYLLHRLVVQVFKLKPEDENKNEVNHKDRDKQNNHVSNLEWCSRQENSQHAYDTGLNLKQRKVIQYDLRMNMINEFKSEKDASIKLKIIDTSISKCCSGKRKTAGGFIFKFDTYIQQ